MQINNKTRKKKITQSAILCNSIVNKTIGLMFSRKPKTLMFQFNEEKRVPLHMFFVFFPIDVLFANKEKKIVEIKENFKPFTFYNPKKKAKYVIELPQNTIKNTKTKIDDTLEFS